MPLSEKLKLRSYSFHDVTQKNQKSDSASALAEISLDLKDRKSKLKMRVKIETFTSVLSKRAGTWSPTRKVLMKLEI